jgi:hypothetical protein
MTKPANLFIPTRHLGGDVRRMSESQRECGASGGYPV